MFKELVTRLAKDAEAGGVVPRKEFRVRSPQRPVETKPDVRTSSSEVERQPGYKTPEPGGSIPPPGVRKSSFGIANVGPGTNTQAPQAQQLSADASDSRGSDTTALPPVSPPIEPVPAPEAVPAPASTLAEAISGPLRVQFADLPRAELSYIYEAGAVEMTEAESQIVPEDEPSISISESTEETPEDEALPYEDRKRHEVRSPKPEGEDTEFEAQPDSRQPPLFQGGKD